MTPFAILMTSLVGSLHCAAMCGGFVTLYGCRGDRALSPHLGYHLGRLSTYLLLGLTAAGLGSSLTRAGELVGVHYLASVLLGLALVCSGAQTLVGARKTLGGIGASMFMGRSVARLVRKTAGFSAFGSVPAIRSYLLGLVTTFLPCGWLYSFVAIAAAAGGVRDALLTMVLFWLGSIPALVLTGLCAKCVSQRFGTLAPKLTACAIIAFGVVSLIRHDLQLIPSRSGHSCHE